MIKKLLVWGSKKASTPVGRLLVACIYGMMELYGGRQMFSDIWQFAGLVREERRKRRTKKNGNKKV
jgi:hypothetical protein